jgi:hypothetical protein
MSFYGVLDRVVVSYYARIVDLLLARRVLHGARRY